MSLPLLSKSNSPQLRNAEEEIVERETTDAPSAGKPFSNRKKRRKKPGVHSSSLRQKFLSNLGYNDGMGNSGSGEQAIEGLTRSDFVTADANISDFRARKDEIVPQPEVSAPAVAYKRYYPREITQQRAANKFFRSCSLQLHFTETGSPIPKKARVGTDSSFISLPFAPGTDTVPEIAEEMASASISCFSPPLETDEDFTAQNSELNDSKFVRPGPITTAVLKTGLKAKVKSFSSWLLNEQAKKESDARTLSSSKSMSSSISRFKGSFKSLNKFSSLSFRSKKCKQIDDQSIGSDQMSTASLNSLSDGRTPWPIPWLEAVFLPEYPTKGPVSEKNFHILGTIARGAFGKVYRVCLKAQPSNVFAMKVQSKSDVINKDSIRQMKDEVSIHESLGQCPFIAHLYASWQSRTKLYTVLQYATGYGDLYDLWKDEGPFSEIVVRIYAAEIASALDFIHSQGVIYRDLKMENIVLDDNGHVQLVDFGLAKWLGFGDRTSTICGTLQYMAPEVAAGKGYDHAVDYWSMGVLMVALLTNAYPFPVVKDHFSLTFPLVELPGTLSLSLRSFISQLLCIDPCDRMQNLNSLQQTEFFRTVDFDSLSLKMMHPFDYIPGMRRCNSCNTVHDDETGEINDDLNLDGFDEQYEFGNPEYFAESKIGRSEI